MEREKIYIAHCSSQKLRKFNSKEKIDFPLKDNKESVLIRSFFKNGNSSNLIDMKWDTSTYMTIL